MQDVIIYIHGITADGKPNGHKDQYDQFHNGLQKSLKVIGKQFNPIRIDIEWGHRYQTPNTGDKILADVEIKMFQEVKKRVKEAKDLTINPLRFVHHIIRENIFLGGSDLFYYISEDGKREVRQNVLLTIIDKINNEINTKKIQLNEELRFTIISHSAGSVIMHDLLFLMFGKGKKENFLPIPPQINHPNYPAHNENLIKIDNFLKQDNKLNLFVTFGSPIAFLAVRSQNLLETYKDGKKIDEATIGIKNDTHWLNFWDVDDVLSAPVTFLYNNTKNLIQDFSPDFGDFFPSVHEKYWNSSYIHEKVAQLIK